MESPMPLPTPTPGKEHDAFAVRSWSGRKTYTSGFFSQPQPASVHQLKQAEADGEFEAREAPDGGFGREAKAQAPNEPAGTFEEGEGGFAGPENEGVANVVEWGEDGEWGLEEEEHDETAEVRRDADSDDDEDDEDEEEDFFEEEDEEEGDYYYEEEEEEEDDPASYRIDAQQQHRDMLEAMAREKAAKVATASAAATRAAKLRSAKTARLAQKAARRLTTEGEPSYLVETKATVAQRAPKKKEEEDEDEDDVARVEKIRATRRRQKEKYKALLMSLATKKKEDAAAEREKCEEDLARRRRVKEVAKTMRESTMEMPPPPPEKKQQQQPPRGSAYTAARSLAAVKAKTPPQRPLTPRRPRRRPSASAEDEDVVDVDEEEDEEVLAQQRGKIMAQRNMALRQKQQEHLEKLASERKAVTKEQEDKEARLKRRHQLRRDKILEQSNNRKLEKKDGPEEEEEENDENDENDENQKPKRAEQRVAVDRLNSTRVNSNAIPAAARDFADWKRKNGVSGATKVFVMTGWYPCVKEALIERGWALNADRDSPFFDLKWTLNTNDLSKTELQSWQLTNHFRKTRGIVTKSGLAATLQSSLVWVARSRCDAIFPRCYDLTDVSAARAFVDDYRSLSAAKILQAFAKCHTPEMVVNQELFRAALAACKTRRDDGDIFDSLETTTEDISVAPAHWELIAKATDLLDQAAALNKTASLEALRAALGKPLLIKEAAPTSEALEPILSAALDQQSRAVASTVGGTVDNLGTAPRGSTVAAAAAVREETRRVRNADRRLQREREAIVLRAAAQPLASLSQPQLEEASELLDHLSRSPQFLLDGRTGPKNLWIVKPAAKSRGRGIRTFRHLEPLLEYCDLLPPGSTSLLLSDKQAASPGVADDDDEESDDVDSLEDPGSLDEEEAVPAAAAPPPTKKKSTSQWKPGGAMWIVQKYLEDQLLIAKRKFDLRQWVLVTNWNPLEIWMYDDCYARFSSSSYTTDDAALKDEFVHLVNNSISKKSGNFHDRVYAENGVEVKDCMWNLQTFRDYLNWKEREEGAFPASSCASEEQQDDHPEEEEEEEEDVEDGDSVRDVFSERIRPRMRQIAKWALMAAAESVEHRANSWELYGFDFMVDDTATPWLIEINSSPACDYSTEVAEDYVKRALVDILKVTLDHAVCEEGEEEPSTGGWRRIHRGSFVETPISSFGSTDMVCRGAKIATPRDYRRLRAERLTNDRKSTNPRKQALTAVRAAVKFAAPVISLGFDDGSEDADAPAPAVDEYIQDGMLLEARAPTKAADEPPPSPAKPTPEATPAALAAAAKSAIPIKIQTLELGL